MDWRIVLLSLASALLCRPSCAGGPDYNPLWESARMKVSRERLDQCFCELQGPVAECCCDVETVDTLNAERIYPLISALAGESYFKFFQVQLEQPCPFWPDDGRCVLKNCHVETCTEEELPQFLKGGQDPERGPEPVVEDSHLIQSCDRVSDEEVQLSTIDSTISFQQREEFKSWEEYDDAEESFCEPDTPTSGATKLSYVDLSLNPERYTGYFGHSPNRIWSAIYEENCFRVDEFEGSESSLPFEPSQLQDMCLEKRAFYRLISGLHASINTHLSASYIQRGDKSDSQTFSPNLNEFVRRFDAATTSGQGPSWLKNLYFAYLLVLRAVEKAEGYWQHQQFYTGSLEEAVKTKRAVLDVVDAAKSCSSLFDETLMFTGDTSQQLKDEFKAHFRNISRIMDCVGCDKCRLWGKLQVKGIGTALKILFSKRKNSDLRLDRREIVALFNVLGRFSSSIHFLEMFRSLEGDSSAEDSRDGGPSTDSDTSSGQEDSAGPGSSGFRTEL